MTDPIDAAIAAPSQVHPRASLNLELSTGRVVRIDLPVGLSPLEVIELMTAIPNVVAQVNAQATGAAGRIALPGGGLRLVERPA